MTVFPRQKKIGRINEVTHYQGGLTVGVHCNSKHEHHLGLKSDLNCPVSFCHPSLYFWPSGQIPKRHIG